jgi:hypothetical protein
MAHADGWYPDPNGEPKLRWYGGGQWTDHTMPMPRRGAPATMGGEVPVLVFKSHIDGRNADVTVYADRIEWAKASRLGLAQKGSEVIPVKSISSVTTERDGLVNTKVRVICSGNTIEFRVGHAEAQRVKNGIMSLVLGHGAPTPAAPSAPAPSAPAMSVADELAKLAALRSAGVLTDEEFSAQKAKLLG